MIKENPAIEFSHWFDHQLRSTLDGFIWAVHQLAEERWYELPPAPLGEWSAAQHVHHMLNYEKRLALPTMGQWLGETPIIKRRNEGTNKQELSPMMEMLEEFEQVRRAEIIYFQNSIK
jgi:hypothetical protein